MPVIASHIDRHSEEYAANAAHMRACVDDLRAKVAAAHPFVLKQLLDLEDYGLADSMGLCGKCGTRKKQMFLKGRKFLWCPDCERKGIDRLLGQFAEAVEQARRDLGLPASG